MKKAPLFCYFFLFTTLYPYAQELIPYRQGDKWGYANPEGELVIKPRYDLVGEFWEEVTWVKKEKKFGYINLKGRKVTPIKFDEASYFGFGRARVRKGKKEYCINLKGKKDKCIAGCGGAIGQMSYFHSYVEDGKIGLYVFKVKQDENGKNRRYIDTLPAIWDKLQENYGRFAAVKKDGEWGVIDEKGNLVTDYQYDFIAVEGASYNPNFFFRVRKNGKYGFLNQEGKLVVEPKYEKANFFYKGIAKVWLDKDFWGYIDEKGREFFSRE